MAYSKQSHSDTHLTMWEDHVHTEEGWVSWNWQCCYKQTVCYSVIAACCVSRLHFSGTDCVSAIYSLRIHYYNMRDSWESRRKNTSQSDCNNCLNYLKSVGLISVRKTKPLQLCSLCILYGFLISYLRQNMLLYILIWMFRETTAQNVKYCPQTFTGWRKIFLSNFCQVFT